MAESSFDAIVIGGGINGLVSACLLQKAGKRTLLLEASDRFGGMAARVSPDGQSAEPGLALFGKPLSAALAKRLDLQVESEPLDQLSFLPDGGSLLLPANDPVACRTALGRFSERDAERLGAFHARLTRLSGALSPFLERRPPKIGKNGWDDKMELGRLGFTLRRLGKADMRDLLRIIAMNAADLLEEVFEGDAVQGLYSLDSVLGNLFGPRSPNTVFTLLLRWASVNDPEDGAPLRPKGGPQALVRALVRKAAALGVTLRADTPAARILVEGDKARGVELEGGETLSASLVLSSLHLRRSCLDLLGVEHLDADMVRNLRFARGKGANAALVAKLSAAPELGVGEGRLGQTRLIHAPSIAEVEEAHNATKYGEVAELPPFEALVTKSGEGYRLQATLQACTSELRGQDWTAAGPALRDRVLAGLDARLPGFSGLVEEAELISPDRIGEELGAPGGHWHHLELGLDQVYMLRPVPGLAQYRTPVEGFYLSGSSSHPGGGLGGAAGANAVTEALGAAKGGRA
jgi:phytoene dehydrogenase-like protein